MSNIWGKYQCQKADTTALLNQVKGNSVSLATTTVLPTAVPQHGTKSTILETVHCLMNVVTPEPLRPLWEVRLPPQKPSIHSISAASLDTLQSAQASTSIFQTMAAALGDKFPSDKMLCSLRRLRSLYGVQHSTERQPKPQSLTV